MGLISATAKPVIHQGDLFRWLDPAFLFSQVDLKLKAKKVMQGRKIRGERRKESEWLGEG